MINPDLSNTDEVLIGLKNDSAPTIGDMASKIGNAPHTLSEKINS